MDEFTLNIKLGNDAMQTPEDVADALERVVEQLRNGWTGEGAGYIRDVNGNTVGEWKLN